MLPGDWERLLNDTLTSLGSLETRHAEQDWVHLEWLTQHACDKGWQEGQVLEAVTHLERAGKLSWDRGMGHVRLTEAPLR